MKNLINHRFGVEIELNSFDGFSKSDDANGPSGIKHAAEVVKNCLNETVDVAPWHTTLTTPKWLIKPDSSCGFEVVSPILKGNAGLKSLKKVITSFKKDGRFTVDSRCGFHVHYELPSKNIDYISTMIVCWIRCELFFCLLIPNFRKQNRYCQLMGMSDIFLQNVDLNKNIIFNEISEYKFYSMSLYHFKKSNRNTVEFRIMDQSACLDSEVAECWILLLNIFINKVGKIDVFDKDGNLKEKLAWLDCSDVFDFLQIKNNKKIVNFVVKRIKELNGGCFSLSLFKRIFNFYFDKTIKFLEFSKLYK